MIGWWIGLRRHLDDLQWPTKIKNGGMGRKGGGRVIKIVWTIERSVDLRWLFESGTTFILRWSCFYSQPVPLSLWAQWLPPLLLCPPHISGGESCNILQWCNIAMLQIVFCSVIYQNNGHNMTYRWRKELAVTKFMMFSLKPTSTSATKPTPFGNAYSPVRVTPIKSPKRYWMSQWASEYTDSSLIKKILPQGSAAVSCCSWFSAFILGALQGALMFCLLIHF